MCTNPHILFKKNPYYSQFEKLSDLNRSTSTFQYYKIKVPCGKCVQCLKARQSDLSARCVCEANKRGSLQFLTLTYDNLHLPLSMCLERVDKDTGEVELLEKLKLITRQSEEVVEPSVYFDLQASICRLSSDNVRYVFRNIFEDDGFVYRAVVTPSLNPRDFRLWLKNARVRYKREFGFSLTEFTYVCCGEMGTKFHRPHYHVAFFGLSYEQVSWMASYWKFGFTYLKSVNGVNKDGSNGFEIASRYISKYMSKGDFECESIRDGYAYKCRLMSSKGLGGSLDDNLIKYFRCYDLVGHYDINIPLPEDKLSLLVSEVKKRNSFVLGGRYYCLPNRFIKQLWYVKNFSGRYSSSAVRCQITNALRSDFFADYLQKLRKDYPGLSPGEIVSMALQVQDLQVSNFKVKNERGMLSFKQFYLNSKF